jgi:hypothetical protein
MKLTRIFFWTVIFALGLGLVAAGWKKTNGLCHEAPKYSGCINMWEQTGLIFRTKYDPCGSLLRCERQSNLKCEYGETEEYRSCRRDYESKKLNSESVATVAVIETTGGLCPGGVVCGSKLVVRSDGSVTKDGILIIMLPDEIDQLQKRVTSENIRLLKEKKFTGTCPTAYDGQEVIYKFYPGNKEERIASCEYEISVNNPLIKQTELILQKSGW